MTESTARMRSVAKRLLLSDAAEIQRLDVSGDDAFPAIGKLHPQLMILMGTGGVRMLVRRALMLATMEVPWLNGLHLTSNGGVERLSELGGKIAPAEYLEGRIIMLAHLLGLLVALIGPGLTSKLVSDIWPQLPLEAFDFALGEKSENAF